MPTPPYPETPRDEDIVEQLHGIEIADPYRWLEQSAASSSRVRSWVRAQNELTEQILAALPERRPLRERVAALWDHPRQGPPWRRGGWWFQTRNTGLQDQDVLWAAPAPDPEAAGTGAMPAPHAWRVLLDPNELSDEGTTSLVHAVPDRDGGQLAYGLAEAGSDWVTWRVRDVASGEDLPDVVRWSKFSSASWLPDGSGFLYGAYDPPEEGAEYTARNENQQVRRHVLGTAAGDDEVVHERPDEPHWGFTTSITHDGELVVFEIHEGTERTNRVHVAALDDAGDLGAVRPLFDRADARYEFLGAHGDALWFLTTLGAPLGRIVRARLERPEEVEEVVAEGGDLLQWARIIGAHEPGDPGWLVLGLLHHAAGRIAVHGLDGTHLGDVDPDTLATIGGPYQDGITGGRRDDALHVTVETWTDPVSVQRLQLPSLSLTEVAPPGVSSDAGLVTERTFVEHDGVRVPVFLVRRKDVGPTGEVPTILYGYGGFDIPITPRFQVATRVWVESGGLFAAACLRGGGEYGRGWHDDGRLERKQHVFDDAAAVADWLGGASGWSSPRHLGVEGRSNGGLLAGALLTQCPERFGSVVPEVGVLDMLRFHRFTIGWAWTSDYGDPDDPDAFRTLLAYSPLHNLEPGRCYPPTLLTTGDTDDRVVPAHSFKFAAALQRAQGCEHPTVIRIDTSAGHGAGKPVGKLIDERADVLTWHAHHLGLQLAAAGGRPDAGT